MADSYPLQDGAEAMKERGIIFSGSMVRAILSGAKTQTRRVVKPQPTRSLPHTKPLPMPAGSTEQWEIHHPLGWRWDPGRKDGWTAFVADESEYGIGHVLAKYCPHGRVGDRLWVREAWAIGRTWDHSRPAEIPLADSDRIPTWWRADGDAEESWANRGRWRPSLHMPRWASRITLEITDVRAQQLQDITEDDARAEGISGPHDVGYPAFHVPGDSPPRYSSARAAFEELWDAINGERPGCRWVDNPWVWCLTFRRVSEEGLTR